MARSHLRLPTCRQGGRSANGRSTGPALPSGWVHMRQQGWLVLPQHAHKGIHFRHECDQTFTGVCHSAHRQRTSSGGASSQAVAVSVKVVDSSMQTLELLGHQVSAVPESTPWLRQSAAEWSFMLARVGVGTEPRT